MHKVRALTLEAPVTVSARSPSSAGSRSLNEAGAPFPVAQPFLQQTLLTEALNESRVDGRRWAPRSILLLGGGVSLVIWAAVI